MCPLRLLAFLLVAATTLSFTGVNDCSIMHSGRFKYMAGKEEVIVTIKDSNFTESYEGGKYQVKANLEWLNSCEYTITITKVSVPDFPYNTGDEVNVKIDRIEGNDIFYTATIKRVSWSGKFTKLEDQ